MTGDGLLPVPSVGFFFPFVFLNLVLVTVRKKGSGTEVQTNQNACWGPILSVLLISLETLTKTGAIWTTQSRCNTLV